jgi:RNA polymerase subunit RPABC4/transcription elongation factor Spt4
MKYCYHCGRLTSGEPPFCQFCGRSYNVKLCPRQHANPRFADVCSQCGSRELSTPQPKVSPWWKVLEFLLRILFGIVLVYLSLSLLVTLLRSPMVQAGLLALGFLLLVLWALWIMLPEWFRKFVHTRVMRKERKHER